ncbi:hypothetical protein PR002_g4804 [Phytophthora rubi]|uniref:RNase H type-1 domain-containing protein n=1 Tax=Phytophthora rubi TaxID=129364 RepID=A0A6A3NK10_9STRA|nr:hypothetical protein PR002_g4804 [Phytophthora rubi]
MAATANLQSAVPAAPKTPGRQHVPPVLAPAPARHVPAAAGKRRRLNSAEDEDMDAEQTTVTAPPPDPMTPPTPAEPALDPATAAAAPTATAPPPTARSTRWGPRPRAPDPTQATTGEPATDPAARRPLAPAAPVTGATRWGPSHRAIGAAAIARLVTGLPTAPAPPARRPPPAPSPPPSADEQQPAAMDVDAGTPAADDAADGPEPWLLRFDGACRRNPGPGGAGAALVDPSGKVVWTCSHYMPSSSETNNTAEYTALLLGVQSAVHHHAEQLTIEGDSHLVVTQVRGTFACRNQRLHQLRNRVRHALRSVPTYTLRHIDRKANAHADRLANRAFDLKRTLAECGMHQGAMADCLQPTPANQPQHERPAPPAAPSSPASPATAGDTSEDDEAEVAARDGGEVFPTIPIGPDSTPVRQPRLRLRPLSDDDLETAAAAVERFAAEMACRITDADSWATGEGYIGAIPDRLREVLQPFASTPPTTRPPQGQQRQRPPRVTRNQREHRLDEALDDLAATQQATPTDSRAMRRARRRVGRIRSSMTQQQPRQDFVRDEAKCVARILRSASAESAAEEQHDTCPIGREELHRHFTGTSAVRTEFDYADERGQEFREALAGSEQATEATDAFGEEFTLDEIEDQLTRAATAFDHVRHRLQLAPKIQQIKQKAVALMQSGLAPWQVVKALKTYVYPKRILRIRHLQLEHRADTHDPFGLRVPHHDKWLDHKTVLRHVRLHMKIRHQTRWKGLVDQGKTVRVHGGPGAKFVSTGAGMSDDDYRFGVKAPLNQVDTNSVLKRKRQRSRKTCRDPTCSEAETLAHVLNHCASNMDAIRQRHDDALEQIGSKIRSALERAKSTAELRLNQTVPEYTGAALRPNIVLRNVAAKRMVIADLAVTFEEHAASARHSSLQLSHDHKTLKYQPIVVELRLKGWQVQTAAIVYGSLGSVQPSNFKTYTEKLKLHKREARQLDLQLSSHCIRASHRMWGWHCRRHREGQRSGNASRAPRGSGGTPRRTSQARARR